MSSDSSDYLCYGTSLQDEDDTGASWKKTIKDPSLLRSLPVFKQKAVDEKGRTRFHGAFTGGFSAGYFNTVGSAAGFTPAEFTSSRNSRASAKQQSVDDFLDEDELEERNKAALRTTDLYDTYAARPREALEGEAEAELSQRPGLVPGLLDMLMPVADSAGMRLLRKMGWRPGRGVGIKSSTQSAAGKWGTVSGVSVENTPLYVLEPKQDLHGLGYDPFVGAEEFRQARANKHQPSKGAPQGAGHPRSEAGSKRPRGIAFGSVVPDEDDAGVLDDYVEEGAVGRLGYSFELMSESDDEDRFNPKRPARPLLLQQGSPRKMLQSRAQLAAQRASFIPGFFSESAMLETQLSEPAAPPPDFDPMHRFPPPKQTTQAESILPPPPEVAPPTDPALKTEIDSLAAQVARSGAALEKVARNMAAKGTAFLFLQGGEGSNYYKWRLHKIKSALEAVKGAAPKPPASTTTQQAQHVQHTQQAQKTKPPLTVQQRMELLGEEALPTTSVPAQQESGAGAVAGAGVPPAQRTTLSIAESDRARLQAALSNSFVKGETQEQADVQPGLRPDAAAVLAAALGSRFTSSGTQGPSGGGIIEANAASFVQRHEAEGGAGGQSREDKPKRTIFDWRPEPLLCKRFNVPDPYKGKPAPPPIIQQLTNLSRADMLALPDTAAAMRAAAEATAAAQHAAHVATLAAAQHTAQVATAAGGAHQAAHMAQHAAQHAAGTTGTIEEGTGLSEGEAGSRREMDRGQGTAGSVDTGTSARALASQFLSSLEHMLLAPDDDAVLPLFPSKASTAQPPDTQISGRKQVQTTTPAGTEIRATGTAAATTSKTTGRTGTGEAAGAAGAAAAATMTTGGTSVAAPTGAAAEVIDVAVQKPLDLFKAIFEADDEEEEEEEEVEEVEEEEEELAAQAMPDVTVDATERAGSGQEAPPLPPPPVVPAGGLPRDDPPRPLPGAKLATPSELGAALMQAQQLAAQHLRERQAAASLAGPLPPPPGSALPGTSRALPTQPARKQEDIIREALKELKRSKHKKKKHKKGSSKKSKEEPKKKSKQKHDKKKHKKSKSKSNKHIRQEESGSSSDGSASTSESSD